MKSLPQSRKKLLPIYLSLLIVAVIGMFLLKQCSTPRAQVSARYDESAGDTLDIAIEYSPMSMYTIADTLGGFNYDLLRYISARYDVPVKFHPIVSREEGIAGLADSTFDMLVADIPATLGEEHGLRYTEPVYLDRQVLVQRRDSAGVPPVKSVLDLGGHTVWVVKGSPMATRIANLSGEIGDTIYIRECEQTSSEQLFMLTAIGQVDMCVVNERTARSLAPGYDNIDVATKVSFTQFQSWLVRCDYELADSIDRIITDVKQSAEYRRLCDAYL